MQNKSEKLTWGDFYSKESIKDNERLMRYDESYDYWDEQNEYDFNHLYDWEDEKERYMKYLNNTTKNK